MRSAEWQDQALCRTIGYHLFFDDTGTSEARPPMSARIQRWRAKQICAHCPVAQQCLDHAMQAGATYGVFGGLDQRERLVLKRGPNASKDYTEIARRLQLDGMSLRDAAERLGLKADVLRSWYLNHPGGPSSRLALAEYMAWHDVDGGWPPPVVSREHQIPLQTAEDMCKAMDRDAYYAGPKGRNRYGTGIENAA